VLSLIGLTTNIEEKTRMAKAAVLV